MEIETHTRGSFYSTARHHRRQLGRIPAFAARRAQVGEVDRTYREAVAQLAALLAAQRLPDEVRDLRREHIEAWMIELLGQWKPATVSNRYRGLQAFLRWCIDEDIIETSPMLIDGGLALADVADARSPGPEPSDRDAWTAGT